MKKKAFNKLEELFNEMVELRRHFHMYPELSFQEEKTAQTIAEYQKKLGLEVQTNVGGNGVVATLRGGKPGKTVAIRADFDALPIEEENNVSYKSKNQGVMHACGHDAHTAIALGISNALASMQEELEGNVVFIHQHAEEMGTGGAILMIEDGALTDVDAIFATHVANDVPIGKMLHSNDSIMAASDDFTIEIKGFGGHAGSPHNSIDVISTGSQLVNNLQQIVNRKIDPIIPAVLTVGSFHAGTSTNIIPEKATLEGTVRTADEHIRKEIPEWIEEITEHTAKTFGADYNFDYQFGYPVTKNDYSMNQILVHAAKETIDEENIIEMNPEMGSEDFAYFLQHIPGSYFRIGSANEEKDLIYPHHHPKFDIDETVLLSGAKTLLAAVFAYWENQN